MLIGLLSDTHGCFDAPLRAFFEEVDQIWHAGDFGNIETADAIAAYKPLTGVYGNCDDHKVRMAYPWMQCFEVAQVKVLMLHIGGYPERYDYRALPLIAAHHPDLFICGHSHILKVMNDKTHHLLHINPGAAGNHDKHTLRTAVRFRIGAGKISDLEVWELKRP
ncbi:MAG: metallophosphatase family protein [Bacteroidales bacterium]|nr:metallophosphatase family protein [Bacteroidales bacterium]